MKYKCPTEYCNWVGVESDMIADWYYIDDEDGNIQDEVWSNWICPSCGMWHQLEDYEEITE